MKELILLVIGLMLFSGCTAPTVPVSDNNTIQKNYSEIFPIKSLGMDGPFIIGVGNNREKVYYYLYVIQPDGSVRFQGLNAGLISVFQTDDEVPRLECTKPAIIGDCRMYIPTNTYRKVYTITE